MTDDISSNNLYNDITILNRTKGNHNEKII